MISPAHPNRNREMMNINNLEDLHLAIRKSKMRLELKEARLMEKWNKLPEEALKAAAGSLIPLFLGNKMAGRAWQIVKGLSGYLFTSSSKEKDSAKKTLFSGAKQLGIFAVLRAFYAILKKS